MASSSCVTMIQPSEEITHMCFTIILHCDPLLAIRQEMLLNFHVQTPEIQPKRSGWQLWKCSTRIMGATDSPVSVLSSDSIEGLEILFQFGPFP